MPYLHDIAAKSKALAEAPTLGNMHPDARAQAIARATGAPSPAITDRMRLEWLHSAASHNVDGWEWGIYRVRWIAGNTAEVLQTGSDFSDLDAAIAHGLNGSPGSESTRPDDKEQGVSSIGLGAEGEQ